MTELTSGINTILVETGSIDLQYVDTGDQFQLGMHSRNVSHAPNILDQRKGRVDPADLTQGRVDPEHQLIKQRERGFRKIGHVFGANLTQF